MSAPRSRAGKLSAPVVADKLSAPAPAPAPVAYPVTPKPTGHNNIYILAAALLSEGLSGDLSRFLNEGRSPGTGTKSPDGFGQGIGYAAKNGAYKGTPYAVVSENGSRFARLSDSAFVTFLRETYGQNEVVLSYLRAGIARFRAYYAIPENAGKYTPEQIDTICKFAV